MPRYWKISNRSIHDGVPSGSDQGTVTYWVSEGGALDLPDSWTRVTQNQFKTLLVAATDQFPALPHEAHEDQNHLVFFVHGYNVGWEDAARRYQTLCDDLFAGPQGLGICLSFDWPSLGSILGYLPDRDHARACAGDLADVLSALYDWLLKKQDDAQDDPSLACKAKVSLIVHSMGNYLTQKALATVWTRKNQPLRVSLINQLVMVAADVDNDLFEPAADDGTNGAAVANLTYRVTALFSGRDAVLGASAGLKHFGTRRLGRSGLAKRPPTGKDNVWDVDCSGFFPASVGGMEIHSGYFANADILSLMRDVLLGTDRTVLESLGRTTGQVWPTPVSPATAGG